MRLSPPLLSSQDFLTGITVRSDFSSQVSMMLIFVCTKSFKFGLKSDFRRNAGLSRRRTGHWQKVLKSRALPFAGESLNDLRIFYLHLIYAVSMQFSMCFRIFCVEHTLDLDCGTQVASLRESGGWWPDTIPVHVPYGRSGRIPCISPAQYFSALQLLQCSQQELVTL